MTWNRLAWMSLALCVGCTDLNRQLDDDAGPEAAHSSKAGSGSDSSAGSGDSGPEHAGAPAAGSGEDSSSSGSSGGKSGAGGKGGTGSAGTAGAANAGASGSTNAGAGGSMNAGAGPITEYAVHNVPSDAPMEAPGDLIFNTAACNTNPQIDTATGMLKGCNNKPEQLQFTYKEITQPDTSLGTLPAALIVTRRFVIEQGMRVSVIGNRPLIVVALDEALISGQLEAAAVGDVANGGGFGPTTDGQNGLGPGGGGKALGQSGGGGAGFCGKGGAGGLTAGLASMGGKTYGNPENVPLIGGSSGAKVEYYTSAGGGAIQISAGKRVEVSALGVIHVGGGGPGWKCAGAGSGGAILLEAPNVRVLGTLAANGGGGSINSSQNGASGSNASADDQPALGGRVMDVPSGGDGSAGSTIDGEPGEPAPEGSQQRGGGGGGGAGRIRINTMDGTADLTGAVISPATDTPCATLGMLK